MTLGEEVRVHLARGRADLAWDTAAQAFADGDYGVRCAARRRLRELAPLLHLDAWSASRLRLFDERNRVCARMRRTHPSSRVGRAEFPVGASDPQCSRFVSVDVDLVEGDDSLPPGLSPASDQAARDALAAVRALEPGGHWFRVSVEAAGWEGPSWSLAVGLAALSALREVPVRHPATGRVQADGRVANVGSEAAKRRLRSEARPRGLLVVPIDWNIDDPDLVRCETLQEAWEGAAQVRIDLSKELDRVRRLDREGRWADAAAQARRLVDRGDAAWEAAERAELLVVLLNAANHTATAEAQDDYAHTLARFEGLFGGRSLRARAVGSGAVRRIDAFDPDGAALLLDPIDVDDLDAADQIHVLGPLAMVAHLRGEHNRALELRNRALRVAPLDERARCGGDLADSLRRLGRLEDALAVVEEAVSESHCGRRAHYQEGTRHFLSLHAARILQALGRLAEAEQRARRGLPCPGLDPGLRLDLLLAELRSDLPGVEKVRMSARLGRASALVEALCDATAAALGDAAAETRLQQHGVFSGRPLRDVRLRLPY